MLKFRKEVLPFLVASVIAGLLLAVILHLCGLTRGAVAGWALAFTAIWCAYFLYFFRDPLRVAPDDPDVVITAAEGHIASIVALSAEAFREHALRSGLKPDELGRLTSGGEVTRISVFLSPLDVHVNRAPIAGRARFLGYFPGKHIFTFDEKSSEENQHNSILIENDRTACLINQIVGPVCRRVVYWPDHDRPVDLPRGEKIGMMKFGSRLDHYFPSADIRVETTVGTFVRAGETVIARLKPRSAS